MHAVGLSNNEVSLYSISLVIATFIQGFHLIGLSVKLIEIGMILVQYLMHQNDIHLILQCQVYHINNHEMEMELEWECELEIIHMDNKDIQQCIHNKN